MSEGDKEGIVILVRGIAFAVLIAGVLGCLAIFSNILGAILFLALAIGINKLANELDKYFDSH